MFLNDKDEVVICGGNEPESMRSCWTLDKNGVWNRAYGDLTSDRKHSTGFSMNGKAYMLGGNYVSNTSEILDYSNGSWYQVPQNPRVYSSCGVVISNEEFLLIGGAYNTRKFFKYNVISGTWTEAGSLIYPRWNHACALYKNEVYISGGNWYENYVEILSLNTLTTRTGNPHQIGRKSHGLGEIHINGQLTLAAFGGTDSSFNQLDSIEIFDNDTQTWSVSETFKLEEKKTNFGFLSVSTNLICP